MPFKSKIFSFSVGDRIEHKEYGTGTVRGLRSTSVGNVVVIDVEGAGLEVSHYQAAGMVEPERVNGPFYFCSSS